MSIEKLAKVLGVTFDGIFSEQNKYISTIEWLLDPKTSEDFGNKGRTTILALGFINAAMENPDFPIPLFDHYNSAHGQLIIEDYIESFISHMPTDIGICFSSTPYTLTFSPNKNK